MSSSTANRRAAARNALASTALTALLVTVGILTGCSASPHPRNSEVSAQPSAATEKPTVATPAAPRKGAVLVPRGSAQQNLPLFHAVTERVWASPRRTAGRAYVDALVKAGFAKSAMQVTADRSTVGNPAESIQFSVLWKDGHCLVGQVGPATGKPVTVVLDGLPGGKCLIGETRPIDW